MIDWIDCYNSVLSKHNQSCFLNNHLKCGSAVFSVLVRVLNTNLKVIERLVTVVGSGLWMLYDRADYSAKLAFRVLDQLLKFLFSDLMQYRHKAIMNTWHLQRIRCINWYLNPFVLMFLNINHSKLAVIFLLFLVLL